MPTDPEDFRLLSKKRLENAKSDGVVDIFSIDLNFFYIKILRELFLS